MVETEIGDVRGIEGKSYQIGLLEGRRGHKQHVGEDNVFKAVRRGEASDYRLTLRRLRREARRRLTDLRKT